MFDKVFDLLFGNPDSLGLWMAVLALIVGIGMMLAGALRGPQSPMTPCGAMVLGFGLLLFVVFMVQVQAREVPGQMVVLTLFGLAIIVAGFLLLLSRSPHTGFKLGRRRQKGSDV